MGHAAASVCPIIAIDRDESKPLHRQVYDAYRDAILHGHLLPGQKIPSSRELAYEIQVSRFPVLHAYAQLLAEGYFESQIGSGTFVSATLPDQAASPQPNAEAPAGRHSGDRPVAKRNSLYPKFPRESHLRGWGTFGLHQPALDQFPFRVWAGLVNRHSRNPLSSSLQKIDPMGLMRFRQEICLHLRTARSVKCDPEQIMIVSGSQQALDIIARVLLDPGDSVIVEEPGYSLQRTVLSTAGCRLNMVPVDDQGMNVEKATEYPEAKVAFVTPSHQFPLGSTMSATRRLQLLNWAQESGAWIVEDDYDSEYRFDARPIASLQGLDVNGRVIYVGTFSKVLFPALRIGYIVIPHDLIDLFEAIRFASDLFPPYLFQEVLADFIEHGHFGRYIRKMRRIYGERRDVLVRCLESEFGDSIEIRGDSAGMHLCVVLPDGFNDQEISIRAARERMLLWPLSRFYAVDRPRHGFVLGFGSTTVVQIPEAVKRLRHLILS